MSASNHGLFIARAMLVLALAYLCRFSTIGSETYYCRCLKMDAMLNEVRERKRQLRSEQREVAREQRMLLKRRKRLMKVVVVMLCCPDHAGSPMAGHG